MSASVRILVACLSLGAASALAGPAPTAPTPPTPPAPPAAPKAAPKAAKKITIKFKGTLREALKEIADKGGINLVITGELKDPAEVFLSDLPADEVLQTVADAHDLKVRRQGSIWTIRPLTSEEREVKEAEGMVSMAVNAVLDTPDTPDTPETPDEPDALESPDAPDAPDAPSFASDGELPDPVTDPKGFERQIQERVQKDLRAKMLRKFRKRHFWNSENGNDAVSNGHLVIAEDQTVGDAVSYGGGLEVLGHVEGDAVAYGGGIHLGPRAEVDGDVTSFGGGITREEGASVGGDEVAFGGGDFGRVVASSIPKIVRAEAERHDRHERRERSGSLPLFLVWFAVLFGSGFLAMMFAPDRVRLLGAELRRDPLRCGITGMLGGILGLPALTIMLCITIIGILVVPVLWVVVAAGCLMGIAALANEIGSRLPFKNVRKTQAMVLASGVLLIELVGLIPVLGGLTQGIIAFLALGAVIRSRFGTRQLGPVPM